MEDGSTILADRVVAAPGIADFAVEPALVRDRLAPGQWSHTVPHGRVRRACAAAAA